MYLIVKNTNLAHLVWVRNEDFIWNAYNQAHGLPWWLSKESAFQWRRCGFNSLGREDPFGKETGIYSSILAWEIPWTEEPGGLQSMKCQKSYIWLSNQTTTTKKNVGISMICLASQSQVYYLIISNTSRTEISCLVDLQCAVLYK